jgi:predicted dehydrogenase
MKQVVQSIRSGKTEVMEVPAPRALEGAVLVHTTASVISPGTERALASFSGKSLAGKALERPDQVRRLLGKARREGLLSALEAIQSRLGQRMPLGYSSAGVVVELGQGVVDIQVGQRVACAGGGHAVHAEYAVVPRNLVSPVPDAVTDEAAAFATLGSIALHGFRLSGVAVGGRVAVIGLGLVGQLALGIARAAGCRPFGIDLSDWRVQFARRHGFDAVVRDEAEAAASEAGGDIGFDAVLICADTNDSDPVMLAGELVRDRGTVIAIGAVGMDIPRRTYYDKELTFRVSRSYGPGRYDPRYELDGVDYPAGYVRWTEGRNLAAFLRMVADGGLNPAALITHTFPVAEAPRAYELIQGSGRQQAMGLVLTYPEVPGGGEQRRATVEASDRAAAGKVRLGVVGAGNFASNVLFPKLRNLSDLSLVGIASAHGLSSADAAGRFGFRYAAPDFEHLLEDSNINTIAVLTRHQLHADQVARALTAGKHVFCEKPLAISRGGLERVQQAMQESGPLLTVGFNRRYAPLLVSLRRWFDRVAGPLVMHYRVNAGSLPADHWLLDPEVGGGRIIGEGCHFIDALTYVCGSLPVEMVAEGTGGGGQQDVALIVRFADGSLGTIDYIASGDPAMSKELVEVFGGGRAAALEDYRRLTTWAHGRRRGQRSWFRQDKGHRRLWEAFVAAVASGGPPPIPSDQLLAVTAAALAAMESLRTGGPVPVQVNTAAA